MQIELKRNAKYRKKKKENKIKRGRVKESKDVTLWDSNTRESTQMLLKKTQIKLFAIYTSEGGMEFECFSVHESFYKLFPRK